MRPQPTTKVRHKEAPVAWQVAAKYADERREQCDDGNEHSVVADASFCQRVRRLDPHNLQVLVADVSAANEIVLGSTPPRDGA